MSSALVPSILNFRTKLTPFVCSLFMKVCTLNPVVYAQSLLKIYNFQSGRYGDNIEFQTSIVMSMRKYFAHRVWLPDKAAGIVGNFEKLLLYIMYNNNKLRNSELPKFRD